MLLDSLLAKKKSNDDEEGEEQDKKIFSNSVACVAADSFPFSGRAEIEQAHEKRASEGAHIG